MVKCPSIGLSSGIRLISHVESGYLIPRFRLINIPASPPVYPEPTERDGTSAAGGSTSLGTSSLAINPGADCALSELGGTSQPPQISIQSINE
jgi:hypothetical protein